MFFLFMAVPAAYRNLWTRGQLGGAAATYTTTFGNSGFLTLWARPGTEPACSQRQCQILNLLSHNRNSRNKYSFSSTFPFFSLSFLPLTLSFPSLLLISTHSFYVESYYLKNYILHYDYINDYSDNSFNNYRLYCSWEILLFGFISEFVLTLHLREIIHVGDIF